MLHAAEFFNFAVLPNRLQSLFMCTTHILDIETLNIHSSRSLEELQLNSVKISSSIMAAISNQSLSTLKSVKPTPVELKSGTWKFLLLELCN